jgi:hypothetical protein
MAMLQHSRRSPVNWEFPIIDPDWDELEIWATPPHKPNVTRRKPPDNIEWALRPLPAREEIKKIMDDFPHADEMMKDAVIREFLAWGHVNQTNAREWLWNRSIYLAKVLKLI